MTLAVVMPVFNEVNLLPEVIARLDAVPPPPDACGVPMKRLLVLVDDGSADGTRGLVATLAERPDVAAVFHPKNTGKGAAVRSGFQAALRAGADIVLIHDADLEYDPSDHAAVVAPIARNEADAVIGSRFRGWPRHGMYSLHYLGNRAITLACNEFTGLELTDIECCLKAMTRAVASRITIQEQRFGMEPELVAKLARLPNTRVHEVPVSYRGRTFSQGKKITWRDGFAALKCVVKYSLRPQAHRSE